MNFWLLSAGAAGAAEPVTHIAMTTNNEVQPVFWSGSQDSQRSSTDGSHPKTAHLAPREQPLRKRQPDAAG